MPTRPMSLATVTLFVSLLLFLGSTLLYSKAQDEDHADLNLSAMTLWDQDDLKIVQAALNGTAFVNGEVDQSGGVFANISDGKWNQVYNVGAAGDDMMHIDFVSDQYLGIDVTDSIGGRPVAFVINRETGETTTCVADAKGTYIAGAHNGRQMLMSSGSAQQLSIASLDKQKQMSYPAITVDVPGMEKTFRVWDGAFSPDDKAILLMGIGTLTGAESRGDERNVFWVLRPAEAGMIPDAVVPLGQIDADIMKWEDNETFSLWLTGASDKLVARFHHEGGEDGGQWERVD